MTHYAADTTVSPEQSIAEIADLIRKYGGQHVNVAFDHSANSTVIRWTMAGWPVQVVIPLPFETDYAVTPAGRPRTRAQARSQWQQEIRRRHRTLKLLVQAQLEAAQIGVYGIDTQTLIQMPQPRPALPEPARYAVEMPRAARLPAPRRTR